ncbi:MAG: hypothetical protein WC729_01670 [Sphingomonas sp.]|jgi:hypothetical protein|uniref:hypothetical protein n=1 Tax=Sphingomonas sp. TaxID=28214 RepID=UPI0035646E0B
MNDGQWTSLAVLLSAAKPAFLTSSVSVSEGDLQIRYGWSTAPIPGLVWSRTADGLALNYQSDSYDSGQDPTHVSSANGTNNYSIEGTMTLDGSTMTVQTHTVCYVEYNLHLFGEDTTSRSGTLVDRTWQATYQITPAPRAGDFIATMTGSELIAQGDESLRGSMPVPFDAQPAIDGAQDSVSGYAEAITAILSPSANPHPLIPPGGGPGPQPRHSGPWEGDAPARDFSPEREPQ